MNSNNLSVFFPGLSEEQQFRKYWSKLDYQWDAQNDSGRIVVLRGSESGLLNYLNFQNDIPPPLATSSIPTISTTQGLASPHVYGQIAKSLDFYHPIKTAIGVVYLAKNILNNNSDYFAKLDKFESITSKITDLRHIPYPVLQTVLLVLIKAECFFTIQEPCSILEVCDFFCSPLLEEKLFLLFKHAFKNYELNTEEDVNTLVEILKDDRVRARPKIQQMLFSIIHNNINNVIEKSQNDFGVLENLIVKWPTELPLLNIRFNEKTVSQVSRVSHLIEQLVFNVSNSDIALLTSEIPVMSHLRHLNLGGVVFDLRISSLSKLIEWIPNNLEELTVTDFAGISCQPKFLDKLTQMPHLKRFNGMLIRSPQPLLEKLPQNLKKISIAPAAFDSKFQKIPKKTLIGDFSRFKQLKQASIFCMISNENLQNLPHTIEILFAICSKTLTQEGIAKLSPLPRLKKLALQSDSACPSTADPYDFTSLKQIQELSISVTTFASSLVNRFPPNCQEIGLTFLQSETLSTDHGNQSKNSPNVTQAPFLPKGSLSNQDVIHATNLLKQMPYLKKLSFSEWELTDNFISLLPKNLEALELKASKNLTDQCAEDLYQMKELRQLNINGSNLTHQAIEKLPDSIEELSIKKCQHITTAIAPKLSAMPNLKKVVCSKDLYEALEDLLPLHIELTN